jgi:hypothetical protein
MNELEIANGILNAMALREKSWEKGYYRKTIQECFDRVFNNSALGKLYALAAISCWNKTEAWCRNVLNCE